MFMIAFFSITGADLDDADKLQTLTEFVKTLHFLEELK